MKGDWDWDTYTSSKAKASDLSGNQPSVKEYFLIALVNNGLLVTVVSLTVLFTVSGVILRIYQIAEGAWCLDLAKMGFGAILGIVAGRRRSKP